MFWKALDDLHRWERENLPGAESPQGNEILVWLLKCKAKPRPLKDLYRSSRFSEPTIRAYLRAFVERGLVDIETNNGDLRTRFARVTSKFECVLEAYRERFHEVAAFVESLESMTRLGGASLLGPAAGGTPSTAEPVSRFTLQPPLPSERSTLRVPKREIMPM
jgi:DNA-binding MarR family transcriptional regulator